MWGGVCGVGCGMCVYVRLGMFVLCVGMVLVGDPVICWSVGCGV